MSSVHTVTIILDRRLLEHPRAYHLRRMRLGLWLYLALLARQGSAQSFDVDSAALGKDMGLQEGTLRSWLGHLRKAGYLEAERLNGIIRVTMKRGRAPEPIEPTRQRFFTAAKLQRALGDPQTAVFEAALRDHSDGVIRKALAGALATPAEQIRRSRTALFLYLLKRHAYAQEN